jgi:transcription-repair coupling factor (superfamily II helicase)
MKPEEDLKPLKNFLNLGSGFNIAMQDLDIRGSGNLLGGEQSGFIADVGFETYQRILNEAMIELRETEFNESASNTENVSIQVNHEHDKKYISDFQIDTDLEIMFPDEYISNISERIRLYKELNEIESEEALCSFEKKLIDRFGKIPPPAQALLDIVRIKWIAVKIGIEKILLKNNLLIANFISDPNSQFYRSSLFVSVMNYVNKKHMQMNMKQKASKLSLTINDVKSVKGAIKVLNEIREATLVGSPVL